jgi:hypothetical protein
VRKAVEITRTDEGLARIRIPRPDTRFRRFLSFIFRLPGCRILVLDETGTEVLGLINGQRTFSELAERLAQTHSLGKLEAQHSMAAFLNRLSSEGVIEVARGPRESVGE